MKDRYIDGEYAQNNPTWHAEDSPWKASQIHRMITKNNLDVDVVAEIGCGVGAILKELQQRMPDTTQFHGYDIAREPILRASSYANELLQYSCQDLLQTGQCYDLLLVIDVIEHISDYMGFVEKCRERATYKIYHIPLDVHASSVVRGAVTQARESVGHIQYFTAESAFATLVDSGHEILDYFYTNGAIALSKLNPSFRRSLANLPRRGISLFSTAMSARLLGGYSLLVLAK